MQKLSKKAIAVITALSLLALVGIYTVDTISKNPFIKMPTLYWKDLTQSSETRTFEIAGRTFEIPIGYFQMKPSKHKSKNTFYIEIVWPEMQSVYQLPDQKSYSEAFKSRKWGSILVEAAAKRPSLEVQVDSLRHGLTKEESRGKLKHLEIFHWYHGMKENPELYSEVYLEKDSKGNITNFFECRVNVPVPGCSQKFIDKGLVYKIYYNMDNFFAELEMQHQRAVNLIDSFEIQSQK